MSSKALRVCAPERSNCIGVQDLGRLIGGLQVGRVVTSELRNE